MVLLILRVAADIDVPQPTEDMTYQQGIDCALAMQEHIRRTALDDLDWSIEVKVDNGIVKAGAS